MENIDPNLDQYLNKNEIKEYELNYPCKKSTFITTLRKIGDIKNQYVTNVYYLDTLSFSYDGCEIYSSYNDDNYSPVSLIIFIPFSVKYISILTFL